MAHRASVQRLRSRFRLPASLVVRESPEQGRGIYTSKAIKKGATVFEEERPFAFGIAGISAAEVKSVCSNCLDPVQVRYGIPGAFECKGCNAVSYCSLDCQEEAKALHSIECAGLRSLEGLRERAGLDPTVECPVNRFQSANERFWPPAEVLVAARALNQEAVDEDSPASWLTKGPSCFNESWDFLVPRLIPLLHPKVNRDVEYLKQVFSNVGVARVQLGVSSNERFRGQISALYARYGLLNHSCQPNCSYGTLNAKLFVYADVDIRPRVQLGINYLSDWNLALPGKYRRRLLENHWGFICVCDICTEEQKEGTQYCLRDQKKRSHIAPWTTQHAEDVMDEGAKDLEEVARGGSDWSAIPESTMKHFEQQKRVLNEANSVRMLTAYTLMKAYYIQGRVVKALTIAKSIHKPMEEYCSLQVVSEYFALLSHCHFDTGCVTEGIEECIRALELYPRNITNGSGPGSVSSVIEKAIKYGGEKTRTKILTLCKDTPVPSYENPKKMTTVKEACKMQ